MIVRMLLWWCFVVMTSFLLTGCGNDKDGTKPGETLSFIVCGSADVAETSEGVRVLAEDKGRFVSTGVFTCQTGSFNLEQVRVAALGQCAAFFAGFFGEDVKEDKEGNATITTAHASHKIGRAQVDSDYHNISKRLNPSHKVSNTTLSTKIACDDGLVVSTCVNRTHDSISGDSLVSQINMPSGFSLEKLEKMFENDKVKMRVLSEYAEFKGLSEKDIAQISRDAKDVLPAVKRLLSVKGGICEYKVVLEITVR